jgi:hypothetical protein
LRHARLEITQCPGARTVRDFKVTIGTRSDFLFTMSDNTCLLQFSRAFSSRESIVRRTRIVFPGRAFPTGGARRDRTDDLLLAKQALSQLSYGPVVGAAKMLVGLGRFELPTSRLSSARSNQLSYKPGDPTDRQELDTAIAKAIARSSARARPWKKEKRRRRGPANGPDRFEAIGPDVPKRSDRPSGCSL